MYTNRLQPCMLHPAACRVFLCLCLCFIAYMPDLQAKTLSRRQCAQLARQLRSEWADSVRRAMADSHAQRVIVRDAGPMRLHWTVFGDAPADGRSLFISLHGGGGAPPQLNDAQWQNQWQLYQPAEGVYLCPRPPFNTWDLHFRPELDEYYADLIRMMVVCEGVNPDKVYVMGYSAGGDGVWRLAPRLADRWAAASMMAGHPGDVSLVNLRNLPFMIWCGANDAAYDRNRECQRRMAEMDSLHRADPQGYVHENHLVAGKGHWMDRQDTVAVAWMARHRRNPLPDTIVWRQGDVPQRCMYWLQVPAAEMTRDREVRVRRVGNRFDIDRADYSELTILLNDAMIDFARPVVVCYNGKQIFKGKLRRRAAVLRRTLYDRGDPSLMFSAELRVMLKKQGF